MNTLEIQQALHAKGFDPGVPDGIRGRRTIAAIKAFQASHGLVTDGIVGPLTAAALFGTKIPKSTPVVSVELPWYSEAWRLNGVREDTSAASNPLIIGWAKDLKIPYSRDETPWCGLFVAHCIASQLPNEPLPNIPLRAREWQRFGHPTDARPGAVLVFWRGSKNGGKGHVGFYVAEDKGAFHVLGGNQSNRVSVTRIERERLLDIRWPSTVPPSSGKPVKASETGTPLSTDEA